MPPATGSGWLSHPSPNAITPEALGFAAGR